MKRFLCASMLPVLLLAACGGGDKTPTATSSKVTVKTSEYKFEVASTFKGGLLELTLDNTAGKESHEATLTRLDAGKTLADVQKAKQTQGPPPAWMHVAAGPGPVLPGKTAVYTGNYQAGTYAFVCHVPAPDGADHFQKGMGAQVEMTAGTTGSLPAGDVSVSMSEFKFNGTEGLKAGSQTVRVRNDGKQVHFAGLAAMAPGKKTADVGAFFDAVFSGKPPAGPPPFTGFAGLVGEFAPGVEGARTLELTAGTTYVFFCLTPDTDGKPHVAKGMSAEVTPQ